MSFNNLSRKFQVSAALAVIETEGRALIQRVVQKRSAKIISLHTGITPRHVYNLRDGACQPGWLSFVALALHDAELKGAVIRWLSTNYPSEASAAAAFAPIARRLAQLPEEGDVET